jgi:sodium transport system permease protein
MGAIFALYVVGGALQAWNLVLGLALTLWGIALPLALLSARGTARRARESLGQTLGLTRVAPLALLGALLLAPALALGAGELFALQQRILPLPDGYNAESMLGALLTLPLWAKLFLIAITPAICEELLFRGALLSGLRRDHGWWRTTLIVAVLFGLVHASIYRFLPTGLLGAILAMTTLSSRSLWPAIALHAAYNGLLVMQGEGWTVPAASAWLALPGLALLVLQLRLVQTQDQEHHANEAQQRA